MFTIQRAATGFASGGKDGFVRLWDEVFSPIIAIDLKESLLGYKGSNRSIHLFILNLIFFEYFLVTTEFNIDF